MIALALTASLLSIQTALIVAVGRAAKRNAFHHRGVVSPVNTMEKPQCPLTIGEIEIGDSRRDGNPASEATIAGGNNLAGSVESRHARGEDVAALTSCGDYPVNPYRKPSRGNVLPSHSLSNTLAGSIADGRDRTRRDGTGRVNPAPGILGCEQQQSKDRHSDSTDSSRVIRPASQSLSELPLTARLTKTRGGSKPSRPLLRWLMVSPSFQRR